MTPHALSLSILLVTGAADAAAPVPWGVASGMEKLRPRDGVPAGREIDLAAARGECESSQIAVRPRAPLAALSAEAAALDGAVPIPVSLYRVVTLRLDRASGFDGEAGEWPDPLVPARDAYFGEPRRAFPVRVEAGTLQAIWVDVCVPGDAPAGRWRGSVVLRDGAEVIARVPVALRVWPFAIPSASSVPVTFGLSTLLATRVLGAPGDPELSRAMAAAALRHRVTPHGLSMSPPDGRCGAAECRLDWTGYDAEMAPILDGTLVPGARGTFAEARVPAAVWNAPDADAVAYLTAWRKHFEERGWADRLWLYTLDEPGPEQLPELARRARIARAAGVRVFATTRPAPALDGLIDAFAPNLTFFDGAADGAFVSAKPRAGAGRPFWYVSCLSHGCGEVPERGPTREAMKQAYRGWPGYEIDRPAAAARSVAWLAFRQRVAGELYYDMAYAWRTDPWKDPRAFAGNGDGTLLYPGRPEAWGGRRPFPIESIRLKVIRDGLEDLEMLRAAEARGLGAVAARLAAAVAPSLRGWSRDPRAYLEARRALAEALAGARASR